MKLYHALFIVGLFFIQNSLMTMNIIDENDKDAYAFPIIHAVQMKKKEINVVLYGFNKKQGTKRSDYAEYFKKLLNENGPSTTVRFLIQGDIAENKDADYLFNELQKFGIIDPFTRLAHVFRETKKTCQIPYAISIDNRFSLIGILYFFSMLDSVKNHPLLDPNSTQSFPESEKKNLLSQNFFTLFEEIKIFLNNNIDTSNNSIRSQFCNLKSAFVNSETHLEKILHANGFTKKSSFADLLQSQEMKNYFCSQQFLSSCEEVVDANILAEIYNRCNLKNLFNVTIVVCANMVHTVRVQKYLFEAGFSILQYCDDRESNGLSCSILDWIRNPLARTCAWCMKNNNDEIKACGKCKKVMYCSKDKHGIKDIKNYVINTKTIFLYVQMYITKLFLIYP